MPTKSPVADSRRQRFYLDGAYLPYAGSLGGAPQIDPYTLERAEVLKGPASVLYGQNQPGGLVNLVSKRPTGETRNQVKFGLGDDHRVNGALDTQGVLDTEQDLAYRLVALARKGNGQVDHTRNGRLLLAPSFSWAVSDDTDLTLLAQVQRDDGKADYQAPPRIGSLVRGRMGSGSTATSSPETRTTTTTSATSTSSATTSSTVSTMT